MRIRFTSEVGRHADDEIGTKVIVTKHVGKIVAGIFMLVFLIFAGVGWAIWSSGGRDAALMAQGAVQTVAQVDVLEVERRTERDSSGSTTINRVTYHHYANVVFEDQAGRERRARLPVSEAAYNTLQEGQDLPLRYAAADPAVVELREGDLAAGAQFGWWFMVAGLAGIAVTLVVAVVMGRRSAVV